ncbi:MAG TPA: Gfo/Idh/MocA family oxidoreductase [Blastocatellia bacterium]|nr:Gfo/Idh/MocA family oxidoreductase [Blastocatellia bacterium]
MNRRDFTKTTLAATATTAVSYSRVLGANDRINLALIGCGDRGMQIWNIFLKQPDVNPVAVCDVYKTNADIAAKASAATASGKVATHEDFRRVLDMKEVNAIVVATPDHWHALPTVMGCQAGKDVYCEKPLSLTVVEGRKMVEAARKHNRVVQTGSQQRSGPHFQRAVQIVQNGEIGAVHKISVGFTRNVVPGFKPESLLKGKTDCPSDLNWDMYLGPAPKVPYDPFRFLYHFRWFWDYSGGQMTNWGAHNLDIARWALQAKAPMAVASFGGRYEIKDGGETPDVQEVLYQFPNAVVTWSGREVNRHRDEYLVFHGTKGTLSIMRSGFTVVPEVWKAISKNTTPAMQPMEMKGDGNEAQTLHIRNFLDCVKSRKRPNADVEDGHLTAAMCHLGNIATRLNRMLKWDAERELFLGDREANQMLSRPYRKPWKLEV